jgi:uncharacterized damage-inducible protein DinB
MTKRSMLLLVVGTMMAAAACDTLTAPRKGDNTRGRARGPGRRPGAGRADVTGEAGHRRQGEMTSIGRAFIERSRYYLSSEYLPKIRNCVRTLPEEDLWWRPNPGSNSVGNLILHLAGNVRQWIISGVGGEPDVRERQLEFDAQGDLDGAELLELIETTLEEADRVLASVGADLLLEGRHIQGREVSALDAIYHAVEHFGMHTGQIVYITKLRTGRDLSFYQFDGGAVRTNW